MLNDRRSVENDEADGFGSPEAFFHTLRYLRSNFRRLEHLETLGLPIEGRSVLEIGAGIGDLTPFFLDRDCVVTSVEPRAANVRCFRARYAADSLWPRERLRIVQSDVKSLAENGVGAHDVVFCYGAINEFDEPALALQSLADRCRELLILEATANAGVGLHDDAIAFAQMDVADPRNSISGRRCFPTRRWVFNRLKENFEHVYMTLTQPVFDRFQVRWGDSVPERPQARAIFVASRIPLASALLVADIPDIQVRFLPNVGDLPNPRGTAFIKTAYGPILAFEDDEHTAPDDGLLSLLALLDTGDLAYDIGAKVGANTIALAAVVGAAGKVVALEPISEQREVLERNVHLHRLRNVCVAQSDDGTAFDRLYDQTGAPQRVALIRISEDWAADEILMTAEPILERDHPVLFVEIAARRPIGANTIDLLHGKGYRLFRRAEPSRIATGDSVQVELDSPTQFAELMEFNVGPESFEALAIPAERLSRFKQVTR
ncbi:MAG TPA: class I SAM-dependent methyltransferase [Candidatus Baltobacteraceae bacterium]